MQDESFQLVTGKKRKHSQKNREQRVGVIHNLRSENRVASNESLVGRIKAAQHEIVGSEFYTSLLANLELGSSLTGKLKLKNIICYGIGHFADCVVSRYQLGLLLALKDHLCIGAEVHDPVFDRQECELLNTLGCEVILENEEGRRKVEHPTLAYFPHCPRQLTNNFLWANWGPELYGCVLLANSLTAVVESTPRRILNETSYIRQATGFCQEISIDNSFRHKDIFNDSALHVFPARGDIKWNRGEQPEYPSADIELITSKLVAAIDCTAWSIVNNKFCFAVNKRVVMVPTSNEMSSATISHLRCLLSEMRLATPSKHLRESNAARYALDQFRRHRETGETLCKARQEMRFLSETYLCYLRSQRQFLEIRSHFHGSGERSTKDTANLVGFKLPHDPK